VSNDIHATSAPTGTDDDMGGNDKLTPSLEHRWNKPWTARELEALSTTSFQTRSARIDLL